MASLVRRFVPSPVGPLHVVASDDGLVALQFANHTRERTFDAEEVDRPHPILDEAQRELGAYFAGELRSFTVPLAPEGTAFQRAVWNGLRKIPFGETRSYAELARSVGRPEASRAVGAANGRNPISILVPCHRVIAANGELTGYAGGVERKRWLLDHEDSSGEKY